MMEVTEVKRETLALVEGSPTKGRRYENYRRGHTNLEGKEGREYMEGKENSMLSSGTYPERRKNSRRPGTPVTWLQLHRGSSEMKLFGAHLVSG